MSLADELKYILSTGGNSIEIQEFVVANQDAILAALRGRDAVLEEAAKVCDAKADGWDFMRADIRDPGTAMNMGNKAGCEECADAIRAMKEGKHV